MRLDIRGKGGFVITDAIHDYFEKKLNRIDKVFQEQLEAYVVCKIYREGTKVEITIPIKFITMRAEVQHKDLYAAIDIAVDKLEAQIRKNKHIGAVHIPWPQCFSTLVVGLFYFNLRRSIDSKSAALLNCSRKSRRIKTRIIAALSQ